MYLKRERKAEALYSVNFIGRDKGNNEKIRAKFKKKAGNG